MRTTSLLSVLLAAVPSSAQVLVKNVRGPGSDPDSRPGDIAVCAGHTLFAGVGPAVGQELWKTDGTLLFTENPAAESFSILTTHRIGSL